MANCGKINEARETAREMLSKGSNNLLLYQILATLEIECGNYKQAETLLRQALYIDHEFLMAHFLMGNLMRKAGNKKAANKHFEQVNKLLDCYSKNDLIPGFDGITAGNIQEMIRS